MLFNKDEKGIEELRAFIPFLYAAMKFPDMALDIQLAEEEIIKFIGQVVYDKASSHYNGEFNNEGDHVLDKLVRHLQLPIALFAYDEYSKTADVSHEASGRKVVIDADNEKIPFEWMLNRDSAAILSKAHKTTDRLISFLDANAEATGWKDSEAQKLARSLFINTAKQFDEINPIDKSRRFFLVLLPFMRDIERKHILPILGKIRFDALKVKIKANTLGEADKDLLICINDALVMKTMARAATRLAMQILPDGVFQNYESERLTIKGKLPAGDKVRETTIAHFKYHGDLNLKTLQEHIQKLDNPVVYSEEPIDVSPNNEIEKKYFRT